jgi:glycosyltransferase involved in cell wall biosynthesis
MRILWIGRFSSNGGGGDAIFDQKIIANLSSQHNLERLELKPNRSRIGRLLRAISGFKTLERAAYSTRENRRLIKLALRDEPDVVVISHEALDWAANISLNYRTVIVVHNVTSSYGHELVPVKSLGLLYRGIAFLYERSLYRHRENRYLVAISSSDRRILESISGRNDIGLAWPGMPQVVRLKAHASIHPSLIIAGTFDWILKRRDLNRFAKEYLSTKAALSPTFIEPVPEHIRSCIPDAVFGSRDNSESVGFGLITDRFRAGFKLKVGAYIASNLIPIAFADVADDYIGLPHAEEFIITVDTVGEIDDLMGRIISMQTPDTLVRFGEFQAAAAERFSWERSAAAIASFFPDR